MQKKEWVAHIEAVLESGHPFVHKTQDQNKAPLLFACDVFRRRKHDVHIMLTPSETGKVVLNVCIYVGKTALEFTLRRDQRPESIIMGMQDPMTRVVTIRGCGTVLNTVCQVVETALHSGWFIEQNVLNTLTQTNQDNTKQRNTTLLVVLRRGSNMGSI